MLQLPIHDWIGGWVSSNAGVGKVGTMSGFHNILEFRSLQNRIKEAAVGQHWVETKVDLQVVVRLRYRDLLDRPREDYYEARDIQAGHALPLKEGAVLFNMWLISPRFSFSELTSEKILSLLAQRHP